MAELASIQVLVFLIFTATGRSSRHTWTGMPVEELLLNITDPLSKSNNAYIKTRASNTKLTSQRTCDFKKIGNLGTTHFQVKLGLIMCLLL